MDNRRQLLGGPSRLGHPSLQSTRRPDSNQWDQGAPSDPTSALPPRWEQNGQGQ